MFKAIAGAATAQKKPMRYWGFVLSKASQTKPAPKMIPTVIMARKRPKRKPRLELLQVAKAIDEDTGMIRWWPALAMIMAKSIGCQEVPKMAKPTIPMTNSVDPTKPSLVTGKYQRIPAIATTRKPGNSRGNSSQPRTEAEGLKVSERKLLKMLSLMPMAPAKQMTATKNRAI